MGCHLVVGGLGGSPDASRTDEEAAFFGKIPPEVNEAGMAARTVVRDGVDGLEVAMSVDWVLGAGRLQEQGVQY